MHYELIIEWLKGIESVNDGKGFNVDCVPPRVHERLTQFGLIEAVVIGKTVVELIVLTEYGRKILAAAEQVALENESILYGLGREEEED